MCERGINFFTWFASPSSLKTCMFFNILTSFERDIHIKNASILLHFMHSNLSDLQQNLVILQISKVFFITTGICQTFIANPDKFMFCCCLLNILVTYYFVNCVLYMHHDKFFFSNSLHLIQGCIYFEMLDITSSLLNQTLSFA